MRSRNPPDALQWTGSQGIGAAVGSLLLLPFASFGTGFEMMPLCDVEFRGMDAADGRRRLLARPMVLGHRGAEKPSTASWGMPENRAGFGAKVNQTLTANTPGG